MHLAIIMTIDLCTLADDWKRHEHKLLGLTAVILNYLSSNLDFQKTGFCSKILRPFLMTCQTSKL
jgi:hypothetical protein